MAKEMIGSLQWEDESGGLIEAHIDGIWLVFEMMPQGALEGPLKESFCLQFIDPYGDTTFNQLQIPVLISELKSLHQAEHCQKHEKLHEFEGVISFIEKARGQVHTYIKFYGD
jgi:hypothetical protein